MGKKNSRYRMVIECEHGLGALVKVVRGFPFEEFQELDNVSNKHGAAFVVIDMHIHNKETPRQLNYLENCSGVLSYSVERKN